MLRFLKAARAYLLEEIGIERAEARHKDGARAPQRPHPAHGGTFLFVIDGDGGFVDRRDVVSRNLFEVLLAVGAAGAVIARAEYFDFEFVIHGSVPFKGG